MSKVKLKAVKVSKYTIDNKENFNLYFMFDNDTTECTGFIEGEKIEDVISKLLSVLVDLERNPLFQGGVFKC